MSFTNASTNEITLTEVGPRDGLQSISRIMPTPDKRRWIKAIYDAGVRDIEVTSFVPAKLMPQLADAAEIVAYARTLPGLVVAALVPNLKGAQAAFEAGAHVVSIPVSASEKHSLANVRKTPMEMVETVRNIVALRNEIAPGVRVEAGISVAFGCTLQGVVPEDDVIRLLAAVIDAGADLSGMADTTGMGNPGQVKRMYQRAFAEIGRDNVGAAHMHNTRGQGLANCFAALEAGCNNFDSSLAGIGGCPHAPGASGNVVTEDLVFALEASGLRTGIDLHALMAARKPLEEALPGEPLYGMLVAAGLPMGFTYADGRVPTKGPVTALCGVPA